MRLWSIQKVEPFSEKEFRLKGGTASQHPGRNFHPPEEAEEMSEKVDPKCPFPRIIELFELSLTKPKRKESLVLSTKILCKLPVS